MKFRKKIAKFFREVKEIFFFLLAVGVFLYSGHKIARHLGILQNDIFGAECLENCYYCPVCPSCPVCPIPTSIPSVTPFPSLTPFPTLTSIPTSTPEFTPTPIPTFTLTPTPTEIPHPTSTLTPTPEITPTLKPTFTPTPTPFQFLPTLTPISENSPASGAGGGEPYHCGAIIPPAPTLLSVKRENESQANLVWSAVTPVTHYAISYGLSSKIYIYGVPNTGNITSFTVGGLQPGVNYCFAVRAINDCAPSELSNEICTGAVLGVSTGKILGVSTLGETGSYFEQIEQILFIIGCLCLSMGLRIFFPCPLAKKSV